MYLIFICFYLAVFTIHSHILMPPFLPIGYKNIYYEQKFRISQLNQVQFKFQGLPKDIFWTNNGTIFGNSTIVGQWKIKISYLSLTQSGVYETYLKIQQQIAKSNEKVLNNSLKQSISIVFPKNLILKLNQQQEIQFKLKNAQQPVNWKFITLPKGVQPVTNGKLKIKIQKEGIYLMNVYALDSLNRDAQACVTVNIQQNVNNFTESYDDQTIYQSNQNMNRLLQIKKNQSQITKQIFEAAKVLGQQSQALKQNQQLFNRISNSLIQLQQKASTISQRLQDALRYKNINEQQLREASKILQSAQASLNLALIQQVSNNNLLNDSQKQKSKAQSIYDVAAKQLQNQLKVINSIQKLLLQKRQKNETLQQTLALTQVHYNDLSKQILLKQNDLLAINKQILKQQQQIHAFELDLNMQQQQLSQQETKYSIIINNINQCKKNILDISKQSQDLIRQRQSMTKQMLDLDSQMNSIKKLQILTLQIQTQDNQLSFANLIFQSQREFKNIKFTSPFIDELVNKTKFQGCNSGQYPNIEGVFKIQSGSILEQFYKTQSGHTILFGNCTRMSRFKSGDQIVLNGYTAHGAIHADTIAPY